MTVLTLMFLYVYMPELQGLSCEEAYTLLERQEQNSGGMPGMAATEETDVTSPLIPVSTTRETARSGREH